MESMEPIEFQTSLGEKLSQLTHIFGIRFEEEPRFKLLLADGNVEIRRYEYYVTAETLIHEPHQNLALSTGFVRLANYIYGKNAEHTKIEMTSPVFHEHQADMWKLSFVMPAKFGIGTLPMPLDNRVVLKEVPERVMAVLKFTGRATPENVESKIAELKRWLLRHSEYRMAANAVIAQYDPPSTIPFLRRNEIHIELRNNLH